MNKIYHTYNIGNKQVLRTTAVHSYIWIIYMMNIMYIHTYIYYIRSVGVLLVGCVCVFLLSSSCVFLLSRSGKCDRYENRSKQQLAVMEVVTSSRLLLSSLFATGRWGSLNDEGFICPYSVPSLRQ